MNGWNTSFLLGWPIFRGYVSFREGSFQDQITVFFLVGGGGGLCFVPHLGWGGRFFWASVAGFKVVLFVRFFWRLVSPKFKELTERNTNPA